MSTGEAELLYLEQVFKGLVEELKQKNYLSQDFVFLTKVEQEKVLEKFIDDFISDSGQNLHSQ